MLYNPCQLSLQWKTDQDMNTRCFICGRSSHEFERKQSVGISVTITCKWFRVRRVSCRPVFFWGGGETPPPKKNQLLPPPPKKILTAFIFIHPEPPTSRLLPLKVLQLPPQKVKACRKPWVRQRCYKSGSVFIFAKFVEFESAKGGRIQFPIIPVPKT